MQEPTRLRLDPEQPPGLRQALDAELARPLEHDLGAMKAALMAKTTSSAGLLTGALPKLIGLAALVGAGAWWLTRAPEPEPPPPAPPAVVAAEPEAAPAPRRSLLEQARWPAEDPAGDEVPAEAAPTPEPEADEDPAEAPALAADPPPRSQPPEPASEPAPDEASLLAAELAAYGAGRDALASGDFEAAAEAFSDYLAEYPEGRLSAEATLGQLEALHRSGNPVEVRRLAEEALNQPALESRKAEVLRVLAEAEVMDGACDAAERAFERAAEEGAELTEDDVRGALEACERRSMR